MPFIQSIIVYYITTSYVHVYNSQSQYSQFLIFLTLPHPSFTQTLPYNLLIIDTNYIQYLIFYYSFHHNYFIPFSDRLCHSLYHMFIYFLSYANPCIHIFWLYCFMYLTNLICFHFSNTTNILIPPSQNIC